MKWADTCVMILPCGRSANTEAGWMKGAGKKVFVFSPIKQEPELMYKIHDGIFSHIDELIKELAELPQVGKEGEDEKDAAYKALSDQLEFLAGKIINRDKEIVQLKAMNSTLYNMNIHFTKDIERLKMLLEDVFDVKSEWEQFKTENNL
jgi:hypothetical protein